MNLLTLLLAVTLQSKVTNHEPLRVKAELAFEITASTTKPTPINIAQHSYFNLAGHGAGSVLHFGNEELLAALRAKDHYSK